MADVFRARDHKLNRFVAIKVLKSELRSDKEFVSKFRVEAQAAAGLSHPNIVNVYDVGEENGTYFIVMELVEGITLKAYILSKGNLSVRETTGICLQVASGLEAAHNNHIIHRDVKPQNIIISTDGTAKVADFGIARAASADTINSNVMGSVHYSAPEQSRGGYSDARSDIYSLGITMYEMLTGRVPFDGDSTVEVALKHLQEEIISPRDIIPDLPRAIEQIILKCTQKSPDRRYQTMAQLIRDLKESLVNPNGDFVRIASENPTGATHRYSKEDLEEINRRSQDPDGYPGLFDDRYDDRDLYSGEDEDPDGYYDERDEYDPDDLIDDPGRGRSRGRRTRRARRGSEGSDRIVTVISILVALAVGGMILYLIIHTFDLLGGGGSSNSTEKDSAVAIDLTAGTVKVPDLLGKTENEAQQILRESNLGYKYLGETSSDEYAAGQIAGQDTAPGSTVKTNTRIGYTLSIGSAQALTVPDLTNKTQADAEKALASIGLLVSVDNTRYSDEVVSGNVITTNPGAGSSVHEGDTVTIYVSQGQNSQSVQVPDTRGKYKEDAMAMLTNSGLYVYVASEPSTTVDANLVIRQDIAPGSSVQTGSSITITVSTGPENAILIDPDTGMDPTTLAGNSGAWMCYAQLQAPQGAEEGSTFRVTLEQNGSEVTVFEGTGTFPFLLNVRGQDGVSTGTAYVYMLDASGNILSTTKYDGIAFYQQG